MWKGIVMLAGATLIVAAGLAMAEETAEGMIEGIDLQSRMIILDNGVVYSVAEGISLESLRPGTEVTVSFEETNGEKMVNRLTVERE